MRELFCWEQRGGCLGAWDVLREGRWEYHWWYVGGPGRGWDSLSWCWEKGAWEEKGGRKLKTNVTFLTFTPGALAIAAVCGTESHFRQCCFGTRAAWTLGLTCYLGLRWDALVSLKNECTFESGSQLLWQAGVCVNVHNKLLEFLTARNRKQGWTWVSRKVFSVSPASMSNTAGICS